MICLFPLERSADALATQLVLIIISKVTFPFLWNKDNVYTPFILMNMDKVDIELSLKIDK